jgi:hypothetical protein
MQTIKPELRRCALMERSHDLRETDLFENTPARLID